MKDNEPCLSLYFGEIEQDADNPYPEGTPAYTCGRCGRQFSERHPTVMFSGTGPCATYWEKVKP